MKTASQETAPSRLDYLQNLPRSYFVSLTLSNLKGKQDQVQAACKGIHLVELRVDLLERQRSREQFKDFVTKQLQLLRQWTQLDILFTVRTKAQAGTWPDDDTEGLIELYNLGLSLSADFLDVEMHLGPAIVEDFGKRKGSTLLLLSHHDPQGRLSWSNDSWMPWYRLGAKYGDIIKLVGTARQMNDDIALEVFRGQVQQSRNPPLIAINMGTAGQMSRVLNSFMTPVSATSLAKAVPGQLSASEIEQAMTLMGITSASPIPERPRL